MAEYFSHYSTSPFSKVVVIDRCPLVVDGLQWRLQGLDNIDIVHIRDAQEAEQKLMKMTNVSLIICEYAPNHQIGLEYVKALTTRFTSPVVIMVDHLSTLVLQALRMSGAVGIINKSDEQDQIESLVSGILDDQLPGWDDFVLDAQCNQSEKLSSLTKRQLQVLALITQGCSNREISDTLRVAEGTVKAHVSAVMKSLGARNRVDLTLQAQRYSQGVI